MKFAYNADPTERHVGFIAEDVPDLVATRDRKTLSAMELVAVLARVAQEQQATIQRHAAAGDALRQALDAQSHAIEELRAEVAHLRGLDHARAARDQGAAQ